MTGKWTNELLEDMREQTDPLADDVVAELVKSNDVKVFNAMMRELVNDRDGIPDSLPKIVHEYFRKTQVLPEWVDQKKIVQGENIFILHGPEMVPMLLFAALPNAYSMAKGAQVLAITAQLTGHVNRRIFRTAQFVGTVRMPLRISSAWRPKLPAGLGSSLIVTILDTLNRFEFDAGRFVDPGIPG